MMFGRVHAPSWHTDVAEDVDASDCTSGSFFTYAERVEGPQTGSKKTTIGSTWNRANHAGFFSERSMQVFPRLGWLSASTPAT
eukprot:585071-Amphidinium_carterae.1